MKDLRTASSITTQKIDSILSFLDDVESESVKTQKESAKKPTKKALVNNYFESDSQIKDSARSQKSNQSKARF